MLEVSGVKRFGAHASITVESPAERVWEALTRPELIRQYFFGSDVITDWKVGGPILYHGTWNGSPFEDKGIVLEWQPPRRLVVTHWSPLSGTSDEPSDYHTVRYDLAPDGARTTVTITQDNNASEQEVGHSAGKWRMVLSGLKKVVEGVSA